MAFCRNTQQIFVERWEIADLVRPIDASFVQERYVSCPMDDENSF